MPSRQKKINFLPIYGAPFKTYKGEQKERMQFPNLILQTIAGARVAQLKSNNKTIGHCNLCRLPDQQKNYRPSCKQTNGEKMKFPAETMRAL